MLSATSFAQSYLSYIVENSKNADLIVEATVESSETFQDETGRIYTVNQLACRQVLKGGGVLNGYAFVETPGGWFGDTEELCPHCTRLSVGENGLFFLTISGDRFRLLTGNAGKVHRLNIDINKQGVIPSLREYVPNWDLLKAGIQRIVRGETITQTDLMSPFATELCYKVDNIRAIDEKHISAKIYAKSNVPNLKFAGGEVSVKYPTNILGGNIVQNNLLAVTAGAFVSNNAVYNVAAIDISANTFKLAVGSNCTSNLSYSLIGTDYEEIAELILEVDLQQVGELVNNTEITDAKGKYYDQSLSGCSEFRSICLEGELFVAACSGMAVEFVDENGQPATAGAGIMTFAKITGNGFKDSPGKLIIPDANTDIDDGIVLEDIGSVLLSWSDDLIEINVSAMSPGIMGSGQWIVDPDGLLNSCNAEVDVKFSLQQKEVQETDENGNTVTVTKHVRRYSTNDLQGAITYYLDNTINNNANLTNQGLSFSKIEMLVKEALCEWESKAGISLNYLGAIDPAESTNTTDAKNVIYFTDAATVLSLSMGTHLAAVTKLTVQSVPGCVVEVPGTPALIRYPIAKDSRIAVNQEIDWYDKNSGQFIDPDETDLLTALLHEIGHSLGMDHALDPSQGTDDTRAMYPFFPAGNDNKHSIDDCDKVGAMFLAQESRELLNDPNLITTACNDYKLSDVKFCTLSPVSEHFDNLETFTVTPNICLENQQVFVRNESLNSVGFVVTNALGAQVKSFKLEHHSILPLEFNSSGIYFITAIHEGQLLTKKIIVQK